MQVMILVVLAMGKGLSQDLSYRTLWEPASIRQADAACREKGESSSETVSYTRYVYGLRVLFNSFHEKITFEVILNKFPFDIT